MLEVILLHVQHISKPDSTQDAVASLHRELLTRRGLSESSGHDQQDGVCHSVHRAKGQSSSYDMCQRP